MNEDHNKGPGRNISGLLFRNKYLIIASVAVFVLAASVYLLFSSPKYKVRVEVATSNNWQLPITAINELRSETAIKNAVKALKLQVSYYRKGTFTTTELYGDSLPIKFVLGKGSTYNSPAEITINLINGSVCRIDQNNVLTDVPLYHSVKYGSLNYTIIKGPAFKPTQPPLTLKITPFANLTELFSKNLNAKVLSSNSFELSINVNNAQKGQAFLNKLIEIINNRYAKTSLTGKTDIDKSLIPELNDSITYYKAIANKYRQQQNVLNHIRKTIPTVTPEKEQVALDAFDAIKPYLTKPLYTFVLIPDGYDVGDSHIEKLITDFNNAQLAKQRQLRDSDANASAFNLEIGSLQKKLLNAITFRDKRIRDSSQPKWTRSVGAFLSEQLNDSLAHVNAVIKNKQQQYTRLIHGSGTQAADLSLTVIEQSDTRESTVPRSLLIYLLALLAGLILPSLLLAFNEHLISKRETAH
ncbi:Wzz/FepE/Etk N-terminal domain-containing protein [Mucilaginibacter kameinonensis]|uniref:Wzz/FepE/Etk N-terminal domain-containing protein n=1 Tax=Mucilaginibacter kameinonensis TaxID=452286 RepID=UPI0013CEBDDC|nr:Wzz/FepE/Etk N-terminal domain-containing protein [Mucilaginibacter kameinonensis]